MPPRHIVGLHKRAYNSIKRKNKKQRRKPMTQIIAALCENRKKIVLVSDRMVSKADNSLCFEYDETKLQVIAEYAVCLKSGTMHEPEIVEDARVEIAGRQNMRQIAEILSKFYRNSRMYRLEMELLSLYGITSFEDFYNKQQNMHDDLLASIVEELNNYEYGLDIILAGLNRNGTPHIYLVCEPGTPISYDEVGYCCKGSGEDHADSVFAFYNYNPSMSVQEALYVSYIAKIRAQLAGGVGYKKTDAWIMNIDGCFKVKNETLTKFDKIQTIQNLSDMMGEINIDTEENPELPPS